MPDIRKDDYELKIESNSALDKRIEENQVPVYMERLELSEEQKKRLQKEIWAEWEAIKQERSEDKIDELFEALDNQYDGVLEEDEVRQFNIDRGITQVKVDKVVSLIMQSFMDSDPKYSISPRPEFAKEGGIEICEKQSDFIDDRLDNLPFRDNEGMVVHNSVLKGLGILKVTHKIKREKRRREERYKGNPMPVIDPNTGQVRIDPATNKPLIRNKGLEEFLQNWPSAIKDYPGFVKKLMEGEEINIIATYKETTYNDPEFKSVDPKNFYVRKNTEGYEGLKVTKLTVERVSYSWWDLKREEKENNFYDVDRLSHAEGNLDKATLKEFENKNYDILECIYYFKLKEGDEEEVKLVLWFDEETKVNIGAIMYPYFNIDCYYIPHYILKKKPGFYQPGIGQRLTGSSIAENAILNFTLEGAWLTNTVTPITKDQDIVDQFLERRFMQGLPINAKPGDIDFLNKYMRPMDVGGMLNLLQYLIMSDDDKSGVSSLMSGRESPIDPTAPAEKTIALLQESGINIKEFQLNISPAFNEIGYIVLNLYYQISKEARKYRLPSDKVVGNDPFAEITRNELAIRTNLQVQATTYDFDKLNQKRETVALYTLLRQEPLIVQNPEAVHYILRTIVKSWGQVWKNTVDNLLPTLGELKQKQLMVTIQAIDTYIKAKVQEAKVTGIPPEFDIRQLLPMIQQLVSEIATPPPEAVQKAREKAISEKSI